MTASRARRDVADKQVMLRWGTVQRPTNGKPFVRFSAQMLGKNQGTRLNGEIDVEVDGDILVAAWAEEQLSHALQSVIAEIRDLAANRKIAALNEALPEESDK